MERPEGLKESNDNNALYSKRFSILLYHTKNYIQIHICLSLFTPTKRNYNVGIQKAVQCERGNKLRGSCNIF